MSAFIPNTEEELLCGLEGEICISTPTMMNKYYNNEEATKDIIRVHSDGLRWVHTGDLGTVDTDGSVKISGRIKRLIVRNGNKIFPSTIEDIIRQNKLITGISIVSMPNAKERHVPVAYLTIESDLIGHEEELIDNIESSIKERLPEFNIPAKYIFKSELPLTNINKIDFKKLEEEALKYTDSEKIVLSYNINNSKVKVRKI